MIQKFPVFYKTVRSFENVVIKKLKYHLLYNCFLKPKIKSRCEQEWLMKEEGDCSEEKTENS